MAPTAASRDWCELQSLLGRRNPPIEFDADFGSLFCVGVPPGDCLVVHEAKNASSTAKIELSPGSGGEKASTERRFSGSWAGGARAELITYT
jgi:hypothetical protein